MSIEREAVKYSEEWRKAYREYLIGLLQTKGLCEAFSSEGLTNIAEKFADKEFGIYEAPKVKAP